MTIRDNMEDIQHLFDLKSRVGDTTFPGPLYRQFRITDDVVTTISFTDGTILNIIHAEINAVQASIMTPDPNPVIHDLFQKTMHWLMDTSKGNIGYNVINL